MTTTTHKTLRGPRGGMVLCDAELADTVDRGCPLVLGGPLPHIIAAKAIALHEASQPEFETYARRIVENAAALAEALQSEGVTVVTGGSENHIVLVDVRPFGLTGRQAEGALRSAGVTLNRNVIPYDTNGSWYTSGLRIGTPAVTTLGMGIAEMQEIAPIIASVLRATAPTKTASGKPSLANYTLDEGARAQAEARARDLLGPLPAVPGDRAVGPQHPNVAERLSGRHPAPALGHNACPAHPEVSKRLSGARAPARWLQAPKQPAIALRANLLPGHLHRGSEAPAGLAVVSASGPGPTGPDFAPAEAKCLCWVTSKKRMPSSGKRQPSPYFAARKSTTRCFLASSLTTAASPSITMSSPSAKELQPVVMVTWLFVARFFAFCSPSLVAK